MDAKRPTDDRPGASTSLTTSSSSQWTRSIQNQSFQPKPTAYSPHSLEDEDPLMLQQRQCMDKLCALRLVRKRIKFYPLRPLNKQTVGVDWTNADSLYSMKISTKLILAGADESHAAQSDGQLKNARQNIGIDALGGLEMLVFSFFARQDLLRVSSVCHAWQVLARSDLLWEPLLFTPWEKYPLRLLLGLERDPMRQHNDVPAILVYMVYQRLNLAQAVYRTEHSDALTNTTASRHDDRESDFIPAFERQTSINSRFQARPVSSVHLVCIQLDSMASVWQPGDPDLTQIAAEMRFQPSMLDDAIVANGGVGGAEDVLNVEDGRECLTLDGWLSTKRRVSERTLRSYLRQLLLAVDALEQSHCEHTDISPTNIVVHCQFRSTKAELLPSTTREQPEDVSDEEHQADDDDLDMSKAHGIRTKVQRDHCECQTPLFQLFFGRRNCQFIGSNRGRPLDSVVAADADMNVAELVDDRLRNITQQQQRQRPAEADADAGVGNNIGVMAATFRNRMVLPHVSMVSSVIQIAMMVWARGRFADTNGSTVLVSLLHFPGSFSSGLRSFLEYANFLIITHSASASKLLRHEYLQSSRAVLRRRLPLHWSTTPINDVNGYRNQLMAYYSGLPSRGKGLSNGKLCMPVSSEVMSELMPRTILGMQYICKALEEEHLRSDRFTSVVAPSSASSSWVHTLACTQACTLQRLDLSRARVPTSVLLRELATLSRLTHLRLPRQILRDENLEHLVAALAYTTFLPQLRGLDEDVRQAMDRMEKSYLMQLDMVTFLLQKPVPALENLV